MWLIFSDPRVSTDSFYYVAYQIQKNSSEYPVADEGVDARQRLFTYYSPLAVIVESLRQSVWATLLNGVSPSNADTCKPFIQLLALGSR